MSKKRFGSVNEAVNFLNKHGVNVSVTEKVINVSSNKNPGLLIWGAIDFLRNHNKFRVVIT